MFAAIQKVIQVLSLIETVQNSQIFVHEWFGLDMMSSICTDKDSP